MYSDHGVQPGTVSSKTSSKILFYSKKEYIFQPDQMGLILKTKDAQQSHRNSTRTEYIYIYIYIFGYINEKEMDFNSRYYYFTRKMTKTASINIKLSNSPNLLINLSKQRFSDVIMAARKLSGFIKTSI
jgi:hypothetical protein